MTKNTLSQKLCGPQSRFTVQSARPPWPTSVPTLPLPRPPSSQWLSPSSLSDHRLLPLPDIIQFCASHFQSCCIGQNCVTLISKTWGGGCLSSIWQHGKCAQNWPKLTKSASGRNKQDHVTPCPVLCRKDVITPTYLFSVGLPDWANKDRGCPPSYKL